MPLDYLPYWALLLETVGISEVAFVLALLFYGSLVKLAGSPT